MKRTDSRRGAAALEFALILPAFVVLMTGVVDLGWLFYQRSAIASAAALGCRAGALVDPGVGDAYWDDLESAAQHEVEAALTATGAPCNGDCTTTIDSFGTEPGRSLGCTVSRSFTPLTGLVVPATTLTYRMVVRMEWQR